MKKMSGVGVMSSGFGMLGRGLSRIAGFLGPIGMIVSVGYLIYDVVKGIWGNQEEEKKDKVVTADKVLLNFAKSAYRSEVDYARRNTINSTMSRRVGRVGDQTESTGSVSQTFVFIADGKETMRREFNDMSTRQEYFNNKNNVYLLT